MAGLFIQTSLKPAQVSTASAGWYRDTFAPTLNPHSHDQKTCSEGYKDFGRTRHKQWFAELIEFADFILTCPSFSVTIKDGIISAQYSKHKGGEGSFTVDTNNTGAFSPSQKNLLIEAYSVLASNLLNRS